jgi:hypothetical protein
MLDCVLETLQVALEIQDKTDKTPSFPRAECKDVSAVQV